ncbi:YqzH family protein [Cytobacillus horneckiae]|uniref:YqzH family protein n=1 Tax=Cytobacillus horneckiae TaxID=549687 RepID=UPI003D9A940B
MDKRLIYKMVQNCLKQYMEEPSSLKMDSDAFAEIYIKIKTSQNEDLDSDLNEIIDDVVYGYVTDSPYF